MVRLLKCQAEVKDIPEELRKFTMKLLYKLLDIEESDLTTDESIMIDQVIKDWLNE